MDVILTSPHENFTGQGKTRDQNEDFEACGRGRLVVDGMDPTRPNPKGIKGLKKTNDTTCRKHNVMEQQLVRK